MDDKQAKLMGSQDTAREWSDMSTCGLLFQWKKELLLNVVVKQT